MITTNAIAKHLLDRARAEIIVLALIAPAPRYRWHLAKLNGLTAAEFTADDTNVIATAIEATHGLPVEEVYRRVRDDLQARQLWDSSDRRMFLTASLRWGPGPLLAMFTKIQRLDNEPFAIASAIFDLRETRVEVAA